LHRVEVLVDFLVERFGDNPYWDTFLAQPGPGVIIPPLLATSNA
jgi:hypothetical protein